jgi:transposase
LTGSASTRPACARSKGAYTGANPVDRGKRGSKLHLAGDNGVGVPLVVLLTAANIPDGMLLEALIDDLPAIRMSNGRRRGRPGKLHGDKAYDSRGNRHLLRDRGIVARIARRGVESSQRLGRVRWKVERTIAWLFGCRRLRVRYERRDARFDALVLLACSLLSFRLLQQPPW